VRSVSIFLGVTFVLVGAINIWLILQASARVREAKASARLIAAHRVGGYLFIALYCVMAYFMVARLGDVGGDAPAGTMIHVALAMVLSPLIFVKVLVARYYKSYASFLMPIGLVIFVLSFVLVGITAGPALARQARRHAESAPRSGPGGAAIGFIVLVCAGALTLVVRRPDGRVRAAQGTVRVVAAVPSGPLLLRLVSITPQTSDAKTLRFVVAGDRKVDARPGQFLTFSFLFDGKRVARSYSICSSAARSGYIEITPKRVERGLASVFLNDRAFVGMTVEANGPFGQFCLDARIHRNVVLLAAGSGITPMMGMLRSIDDLRLDTKVTLLYCVRTIADAIFHSELERLRTRLPHFQYHLLLSRPHAEWTGPRGHVNREFIEDAVTDLTAQDFFLCGPPAFMDTSRAILTSVGVKPERIRDESFGGAVAANARSESPSLEGTVQFFRSGKIAIVRGGQTLLQASEEQGVEIPSSCRQGQCGTCKTKLLAGRVRMDAEDGLDRESRARGFVLTCVGHPEGAVMLDA
jgi:ferredoxin-NADP reductase